MSDRGHVARFLAVLAVIVVWPGGALVAGLLRGGQVAALWLLLPILGAVVLLLVVMALSALWDFTA